MNRAERPGLGPLVTASCTKDAFGRSSPRSSGRRYRGRADGAIWFTQRLAGQIGRLDPTSNGVKESTRPSLPVGPDGALWFTEQSGHAAGRMTLGGVVQEIPLPFDASLPVRLRHVPLDEIGVAELARRDALQSLVDRRSHVAAMKASLVPRVRGLDWKVPNTRKRALGRRRILEREPRVDV